MDNDIRLTSEEAAQLLVLLNVHLYDLDAIISHSHDADEVRAYREHQELIRKWIKRLSHPTQGESEAQS